MARKRRHHTARANPHASLRAHVTTCDEDHLLTFVRALDVPFLLALDCVQDPHNLGACLRTADAVGVQAVVVPRRRAAPITETVREVACGAAEHVLFAQVTNLVRTLRDLKVAGCRIVGTDHAAPGSLFEQDLTGPLVLVIGAEGRGLRRLTADTCDALVSIPMFGTVPCLNASVAAGVCLFEAKRQRLGLGRQATS